MELPNTPAEREPNGMPVRAISAWASITASVGTLLLGIAAVITAVR